jgi:HIRAN domain
MGVFDKLLKKRPTVQIKTELNASSDLHSKLAGTTNYQDALKKCKRGDGLWLLREPKNPYDPNAISVWSQSKELIGYIKKDLAAELAPQMDRGQWIEVKIANLTGGTPDKPTIGCNIHITFEWVENL